MKKKYIYECDPEKNTECGKQSCAYLGIGDCQCTLDLKYAKDPEPVITFIDGKPEYHRILEKPFEKKYRELLKRPDIKIYSEGFWYEGVLNFLLGIPSPSLSLYKPRPEQADE